jgi:hypothetical protein
MMRILPVLLGISGIVHLPEESSEFRNCQTGWGIAFLIILCLELNISKPTFGEWKSKLFATNPLRLLYSLFEFRPSAVVDLLGSLESPQANLLLHRRPSPGRRLRARNPADDINHCG